MQTITTTHITTVKNTKHIGRAICLARKALGVGRKTLADRLGISCNKMLHYENGQAVIPHDILVKLFISAISYRNYHE